MNWYKKAQLEQVFRSTGILRVEPKGKTIEPGKEKGWLIIEVDKGLSEYYIKQFNWANRFSGQKIVKPSWGSHISVVRGEKIIDEDFFKTLEGKEINFNYKHLLHGDNKHFWLNVECPEALDIREKLGLSREPHFPLHLTIGVIGQ